MILKCSDLPPCQVNADTNGEFGNADAGEDRAVPQRQCWNRFYRTEPDREIRVVAVGSDRAEVLFLGQEGARRGPRRDGQSRGVEMPQITRLIRAYRQDGEIRVHGGGPRRRFPVKYT